jgi:hypothetical protein
LPPLSCPHLIVDLSRRHPLLLLLLHVWVSLCKLSSTGRMAGLLRRWLRNVLFGVLEGASTIVVEAIPVVTVLIPHSGPSCHPCKAAADNVWWRCMHSC